MTYDVEIQCDFSDRSLLALHQREITGVAPTNVQTDRFALMWFAKQHHSPREANYSINVYQCTVELRVALRHAENILFLKFSFLIRLTTEGQNYLYFNLRIS